MKRLFLSFIFLSIALFSYSQSLQKAFSLAGDNIKSLKTVLEHYEKTGNKEKYEAAVFLIENIDIHESHNYKWIDLNGNSIGIEETDYANTEEFIEVLERYKDSINVKPLTYTEKDIDVITSDILIENIDLAFSEWKNNPWSNSYSFETFCEYILPYRNIIEPLDRWREDYKALVYGGVENVMDTSDPVDVTTHILLELSEFDFSNEIPNPTPLLSPQHLLFRKRGSCPDLANLAVFACRSMGIAVTFDFTPHHAASSNRHFWNTVVDNNGKHIPFNGIAHGGNRGLPLLYNLNIKRIGKVFRKTYSIQNDALATKVPLKEIPKCFLHDKNLKDVTNEYVDVGSIFYKDKENKTSEIAFLNVFNYGSWRITDWGKKENKNYIFKNLGLNVVYLPSMFINGKNIYAPFPILLDNKKKSHILKPHFKNTFSITLNKSNQFKNEYKDNNSLNIQEGIEYSIQYWESEWKTLKIAIATKDGVLFENLPQNALFRLLPKNYDNFERIFIIDKYSKKIIWY